MLRKEITGGVSRYISESSLSMLYRIVGQNPTVEIVERIFTWGVSFAYLCGFSSLYIQIEGLQGNKGIIPMSKRRLQFTSFLFNNPFFGKKPDLAIDILCLSGLILSFSSLMHRKYRTMTDMISMWYLYSCLKPDDPPLLEDAGFLACLVAPAFRILQRSPRKLQNISMYATGLVDNASHVGLIGCRWLLFVLMFESGTAKLLAGINEWWNLSGMQSHLQSQPYPTPLSRYTSLHLPTQYLRFSTGITLMIETYLPILFLYPFQQFKILRNVATLVQVMFQLGISAMGNFGFFNMLTTFLSFTLLTPSLSKRHQTSSWLVNFAGRVKKHPVLGILIPILTFGTIVSNGFNITIQRLTPRSFVQYVSAAFNYSMVISLIELFYAVRNTLVFAIWFDYKQPSVIAAFSHASNTSKLGVFFLHLKIYASRLLSVLSSTTTACYVLSSFAQSSALIENTVEASQKPRSVVSIPGLPSENDRKNVRMNLIRRDLGRRRSLLQWRWPPIIVRLAQTLQKYGLLNSFALFVNLTNVDEEQCKRYGFKSKGGRLELIIEASYNRNHGYQEIPFAYKPNGRDLTFFVAPYHPILEYQLWQATNRYIFNRVPFPKWFDALLSRILHGEDAAITLLDREEYYKKFRRDKPPKYIRASVFLYRFTDKREEDLRNDLRSGTVTHSGWTRDRVLTLESLSRNQLSTDCPKIESKYGFYGGKLVQLRKWVTRNWLLRRGRFVWAVISLLVLSRHFFAYTRFRNIWIRLFFRFRYVYVVAIYFALRFE